MNLKGGLGDRPYSLHILFPSRRLNDVIIFPKIVLPIYICLYLSIIPPEYGPCRMSAVFTTGSDDEGRPNVSLLRELATQNLLDVLNSVSSSVRARLKTD